MGIYEPSEDSYLMQKHVREFALGRILDMGTSSGIQALTAITNPNAQFVLAVDTDAEAVAALEQKIKSQKIRKLQALHSDLFSNIPGKFNLIIFNPPYLPQDKGIEDHTLYGGKKGWELSEQFFRQASAHLFPDGKILFLFSSLTNKKKIDEILARHLFQFQELEREKIAFEELYLYLIEKKPLLRELEKKGLQNLAYFTHGKRGDIYTATLDTNQFVKCTEFSTGLEPVACNFARSPVSEENSGTPKEPPRAKLSERKVTNEVTRRASHWSITGGGRFLFEKYIPRTKNNLKVAIKVERKESPAANRIENEVKWLQIVNQKGIGPRYLFHGEPSGGNYVAYEFAEGLFVDEWIKIHEKKEILEVLTELLRQCWQLDQLKINKEELHHPFKHIIITIHNNPVLLDFERCTETEKPKNVTQLLEFICRIKALLGHKSITINPEKIRNLAKEYKEHHSPETFQRIAALFL